MISTRVKITKVDLDENLEGTISFEVNKKEFSAFCYGETFSVGEELNVELTHLDYPLTREVIFNENKSKELRIEKANNQPWNYYCYGKILSVDPIIADFGELTLELGNWSKDQNIIGEYIFWNIDRLDISRTQ